VALFLAILVIAVVPLAAQYERDSRAYEIQNLAATLEFFAERGAAWLDVRAITTLSRPEHKATPAYRRMLADLKRIVREFGVDNAVVMRREANGRYSYVAIDHDGFDIADFVHIHALFPGSEVYGKVVAIEPAADGGVLIALALTAMPPDVREVLEERMAAHA
jgi:hypothetical protein